MNICHCLVELLGPLIEEHGVRSDDAVVLFYCGEVFYLIEVEANRYLSLGNKDNLLGFIKFVENEGVDDLDAWLDERAQLNHEVSVFLVAPVVEHSFLSIHLIVLLVEFSKLYQR